MQKSAKIFAASLTHDVASASQNPKNGVLLDVSESQAVRDLFCVEPHSLDHDLLAGIGVVVCCYTLIPHHPEPREIDEGYKKGYKKGDTPGSSL